MPRRDVLLTCFGGQREDGTSLEMFCPWRAALSSASASSQNLNLLAASCSVFLALEMGLMESCSSPESPLFLYLLSAAIPITSTSFKLFYYLFIFSKGSVRTQVVHCACSPGSVGRIVPYHFIDNYLLVLPSNYN